MITLVVLLTVSVFLVLLTRANESYFHTFAYSQTTGAAITNIAINGVPDSILTLSTATTFLTPAQAKLVMSMTQGVTATRSRLNIPSLRYVGLPSMTPINTGAAVSSPLNIWNMLDNPIDLPKVEPISVEGTDTAIDTISVVLWAMLNFTPVPPGKKYRVRGTAAIAGVINTWQNGTITLDQVLPQGQYALVGMDVVAANVLAARLIFAGTGYRPGCPARNSVSSVMHPAFTDGRLGCYGKFENANVPNLEILLGAGGASAAQEVFIDLIRLGDVN